MFQFSHIAQKVPKQLWNGWLWDGDKTEKRSSVLLWGIHYPKCEEIDNMHKTLSTTNNARGDHYKINSNIFLKFQCKFSYTNKLYSFHSLIQNVYFNKSFQQAKHFSRYHHQQPPMRSDDEWNDGSKEMAVANYSTLFIERSSIALPAPSLHLIPAPHCIILGMISIHLAEEYFTASSEVLKWNLNSKWFQNLNNTYVFFLSIFPLLPNFRASLFLKAI